MNKIIFVIALAFASIVHAEAAMDVNTLNQKIKKAGAHWVAKPMPVRPLMGLKRDPPVVQFRVHRVNPLSTLPASVDWRNKDGANWVSPVLDQANCGSCVAFAAIGTLETQYKIASGLSSFNIKLSPQHLFSCGGGACGWGWDPGSAAQYLQSSGVPDESCQPYLSGATGQDVSCTASCGDASARSIHIASYTTPSQGSQDLESVKKALQNGPLVTTLSVYADFMMYSSGVYKHVSGDMLGGHAISIVGYDDNTRSLIIRNSWGHGWGEGGFAHVSYDDVSGVGDETWSYQMPSSKGAVTVDSPMDYSYFSGIAGVKAQSTFANTNSLSVSFFDASGKAIWTQNCEGQVCTPSADVSGLADGKYSVQAKAFDATGAVLGTSTQQLFYVANQKPQLSLSFTGTNGTNLSSALSDRIEVSVHATSSTVPMSSVEFHYRGADGKDNSRTATVVVDGMTMGWRTNLVPNGSYEIWMVGHVAAGAQDTVVETPHLTVQTSN